MEKILKRHNYILRSGYFGNLDPVVVDAVVSAACVASIKYPKENAKWGNATLFKILDALTDETEGYSKTMVVDARVVADGIARLSTIFEPPQEPRTSRWS